ncbi:arsenate reductase family protein [Aureibacter tunicatorum]|uniref:Arsenate reductase n=1 Tax=Aureibacter tunicatorum TaxID=866807 RepID=A0AAE3XQV8_9BACT|nr:ArsC/Spx/MgsR family protein [Aureibacter tunicatorum]MDR6239749.1 arsenate reductase [Aureibacter tunicatorum]BDD04225.1 arsenate reductase [Aureibacter tunicatorum]
MENVIYYLSTCTTCKRILSEIDTKDLVLREIKSMPISENEIEEMHSLSGSYEALFSRRARKYAELGLKDQKLAEEDYKKYIMDEYTFLKRPVAIIDGEIFVGNSKKNVEALIAKVNS